MSPVAAGDHALCAKRLVRILDDARPDDMEVVETFNVEADGNGLIPEVVIVQPEPVIEGKVVYTADDLFAVAEIVSPGNKRKDYEDKPRSYAAAGIRTYIRVELHGDGAPRVEVFGLKDGVYEHVAKAAAGEALGLTEPFPVSFDPAVLAGARRRKGVSEYGT